MSIPRFTDNQIEAISKIIADTNEGVSGSELTRLLAQIGIDDPSTNTKWRKLDYWLKTIQTRQNSANNVVQFIQNVMEPSRFIENPDMFHNMRTKLNTVLLLLGLEVNPSGKVIIVVKANTLDEAQKRSNELKQKLTRRTIHSNVLIFCEREYLQKNYFHSVFEAVKSILDRIRAITNLTDDGVPLIIKAFDEKKPKLTFNKYQTTSEQNELMGFRSLLIGLIKMVRNPIAHEPKLKWIIDERDTLDILTMVSYAHRKLDETFKTGY